MAVGVALAAVLYCGQAHAVGLGEIELSSALNQKFDAEIELLEARGLQPSEVVVRLASNEDFERVGVERFFFLTDLKFKVVQSRDGRTLLKVTSAQPISEPFLNFVVQVIWPNGRLLKEYTVLLDPPAFTDNVAPAIAAAGRTDPGGGGAGRVERPPRPDSQVALPRAAPPRAAATAVAPSDRLKDGTYGSTDRDDTLWRIASRVRSGGANVQQTMLAIARLNPEAFIGGNINLLKAGYVLRLPSDAEAASLSSNEAMAAVAEHNQAWQEYRRTGSVANLGNSSGALAGQVDATASRVQQPAAAARADGELRIVAGDVGTGGASGSGGTAAVEALEAQLAATEEEVDRVSRERDEAVYRLDQTAAQTEQAQREIEVRDQQIAQLQSQLESTKSGATPTDAAATAATTPKDAAADGGIASLLASPVLWIGGGIVAVLLLVAGLISARRRRAEADNGALFDTAAARRRGSAAAAAPVAVTPERDYEEEIVPDPVDEDEAPTITAQHEEEEHTGAQTSDVIGEADIYIAYGRYPQALNLLVGALDEDPSRSDVRLKLLEIYAETKDGDAFEKHMTELVERCDDNEILLEARELATKMSDEGGVRTAAAAPIASRPESRSDAVVDEFDLDLELSDDDAPPALELEDDIPDSTAGRGDELGGDLGIDFDPDSRPSSARGDRGTAQLEDNGDLALAADGAGDSEFDLEDLELDVEAPKGTASKPSAPADDAFDFLDEEDTASTKLDLARAYIDMGDEDGAKEILAEVLQEGSTEQQKQAKELLGKIA